MPFGWAKRTTDWIEATPGEYENGLDRGHWSALHSGSDRNRPAPELWALVHFGGFAHGND